jgi:hypothetical protein
MWGWLSMKWKLNNTQNGKTLPVTAKSTQPNGNPWQLIHMLKIFPKNCSDYKNIISSHTEITLSAYDRKPNFNAIPANELQVNNLGQ